MPGKLHSHWVCLRSHANPAASDVDAGAICLGTDGSSIYMTTSDGTTTAINGSAVMKDINLDDNAADEFRLRQASDEYIKVSTTDGSEVLALGNTGVTTLGATLHAATFSATTTGTITMTATGDATVSSSANTVVAGANLYVGAQNSTNPVYVANGGAREVTINSIQGTATQVRAADSTLVMNSDGVRIRVKDGEELQLQTEAGHTILDTDFGSTDDITIGDVAAFAGQQLIADVATVLVNNDLDVVHDLTVQGEAAVTGDLELTGGGSLKASASITAMTVSATGQITQLGTSTPTTSQVLSWDGTEWIATTPQSGGASALSGLSDVDNGLSPADNNLLQYSSANSVFEAVTPASILADHDIGALGNVDAGAATDGQFLKYNNSTSEWEPHTLVLTDADVNATYGAGIDGYSLKWVNASSEWQTFDPAAAAVAAVEGEATLDLTGAVTTQHGGSGALAAVGGGNNATTGFIISTDSDTYSSVDTGVVVLEPGYRYDIYFTARVGAVNGTVTNQFKTLFPAVMLTDGSSAISKFASNTGFDPSTLTTATMMTVRLSLLVLEKPSDTSNVYVIPSGICSLRVGPNASDNKTFIMLGWANGAPLGGEPASDGGVAVQVAKTQTKVRVGIDQAATGTAHSAQNHLDVQFVGAWCQAFPGLAILDGDGSGNHPT